MVVLDGREAGGRKGRDPVEGRKRHFVSGRHKEEPLHMHQI